MDFAFDRSRHDRAAHLRKDPESWATDDCLFLIIGGEHVATTDGPSLAWFRRSQLPDGELLFLGLHEGQSYGAVLLERIPEEFGPTSIRTLAPQLSPVELSVGIHAIAMGRWLHNNQYCPRCGEEVSVRESGHLLNCPACQTDHFPRTDPAVIMLVLDQQERALLARNSRWPQQWFSTLAGFVEPGESLEDAVRREVFEEVGVVVENVTYLASQPWPFPTSLMLGFYAHASATEIRIDENEIAEARWFTREELRAANQAGEVKLPPSGVSISTWLIEKWLGEQARGGWVQR